LNQQKQFQFDISSRKGFLCRSTSC